MPDNVPFFLLMPLKWPYMITDRFNAPRNYTFARNKLQKHEGLDFAPTRPINMALEVLAGQRGVVSKVGFSSTGYGNYVRIDHDWSDGRWITWYGHLEKTLVSENMFVQAGQVIGIAGNTGFSTGTHLHLTLQRIGKGLPNYVVDDVVDPEPFLTGNAVAFNEMSWVADVSIQDGTPMQPGQPYTKTWRVRNSGTTTWGTGYTFAYAAGEKMSGPASVNLPAAQPGQEVEVTVPLVAPTAVGRYKVTYRPKTAQGVFFDHGQWAEITVIGSNPIPTPSGRDEAGWVADVTINDGTEMRPGQSFLKTWRMKNNGTTTWPVGYHFAYFSGEKMGGPESVPLPQVKPGEEFNVSVQLVAPATPGTFRTTYKPRNARGEFFEHDQWVEIKVVGQPLSNEAALVSEGFTVEPGQMVVKSWVVRNNGQTTWGTGYTLTFASGERMSSPENVPLPVAKPGDEIVVTSTLIAPESVGTHRGTWRLKTPRGDFFGPPLTAVLVVVDSLQG